jgi:hypothetical protein
LFKEDLAKKGQDVDSYLEQIGKTKSSFRKEIKENNKFSIEKNLLLTAITQKAEKYDKIYLGEDLREELLQTFSKE